MKRVLVLMILTVTLFLNGCQAYSSQTDSAVQSEKLVFEFPERGIPYDKHLPGANASFPSWNTYEEYLEAIKKIQPQSKLFGFRSYEEIAFFGVIDGFGCYRESPETQDCPFIYLSHYTLADEHVPDMHLSVTVSTGYGKWKDPVLSDWYYNDMGDDLRFCPSSEGLSDLVIGNAWYSYNCGELQRISYLVGDHLFVIECEDFSNYPTAGGNIIVHNLLNKSIASMQISALINYLSLYPHQADLNGVERVKIQENDAQKNAEEPLVFELPEAGIREGSAWIMGIHGPYWFSYEDYLKAYERSKKEDNSGFPKISYEDVSFFGAFLGGADINLSQMHNSTDRHNTYYVVSDKDYPTYTFRLGILESFYQTESIKGDLCWGDMNSDLRTCVSSGGISYLVIENAYYKYSNGNLTDIGWLVGDTLFCLSGTSLFTYPEEGGNLIIQNLLNKGTAPMQIAVLREYYSQ